MSKLIEVCCSECGTGLGLWYPDPYPNNVYCEDCYEAKDDSPCESEKEELEQQVEELESEKQNLEAELERVEGELQDAEIREADLEQQLEEPVEA